MWSSKMDVVGEEVIEDMNHCIVGTVTVMASKTRTSGIIGSGGSLDAVDITDIISETLTVARRR